MTTIAEFKSDPRGHLVYWLAIAGWDDYYSTDDIQPSGVTWDDQYVHRYPYLQFSGLTVIESASFLDGVNNVEPISLEVVDYDGAFTSVIRHNSARSFTRIGAPVSTGATAITVESVNGFASSGEIYIGRECIHYTSTSSTQFRGCTRGYRNTTRQSFRSITETHPPVRSPVFDGFPFMNIKGQRANVYYGVYDPENPTGAIPCECGYRGYITTIYERDGVYTIELDSIMTCFGRKVGKHFLYTGLKKHQAWVDGLSKVSHPESRSGVKIFNYSSGVTYPTVSAGLYGGSIGLVENSTFMTKVSAAMYASTPSRRCFLSKSSTSDVYAFRAGSAAYTNYYTEFTVIEGDILHAVGFTPKSYIISPNSASDAASIMALDADGPPALVNAYIDPGSTQYTTLAVDSYEGFKPETWVKVGDRFLMIHSMGTSLQREVMTFYNVMPSLVQQYKTMHITESEDCVMQECLLWDGVAIDTVLSDCFGWTGLPSAWCIYGVSTDDVDMAELNSCLAKKANNLRYYNGMIDEPTELGEIVNDRLGLLGIVPRLTTEGRIGFVDLCPLDPDYSHSIAMDSDMVLAKIPTSRYAAEAPLTGIRIEHTKDYIADKMGAPTTILYQDGFNEGGDPIQKVYNLPMLACKPGAHAGYENTAALTEAVLPIALSSHFGVFGRCVQSIDVQLSPLALNYRIGDLVRVYHELLPDHVDGTRGISNRYGWITKLQRSYCDEPCSATVIIPQQANYAVIAPSAYFNSWDDFSFLLETTNKTIFSSDDLAHFRSGDTIYVYGARSPVEYTPVTIHSVYSMGIILNSDPFSTGVKAWPSGGVIITPADIDTYGSRPWGFFCDSSYYVGVIDPEEGDTWHE
jgi:hypothetical protein